MSELPSILSLNCAFQATRIFSRTLGAFFFQLLSIQLQPERTSDRLWKPKSSQRVSHGDKLPVDLENFRGALITELTSTIAMHVKAAIYSALAPVVASDTKPQLL